MSAKRGISEPPVVIAEYRHTLNGAAVSVDDATIETLRRLPYVAAVHRSIEVRELSQPGAPARSDRSGLRARSSGLGGGSGIVIAILDSGIDYNHPAFGGFGPGRKVAGGWDFVNGDADPMDDRGHGTHVAGIAAGDGGEVVGFAPKATLLAFKVLDETGRGNSAHIIAALERAVDPNGDGDTSDHADVINLSLGGGGGADDPMARAVDAAVAAGAVVTVSAGNAGEYYTVGTPGAARRAITVGATEDSGEIAVFSSRGPSIGGLSVKPEVTAPGVEIVSAALGTGTVSMSGTSMAAPYVAGLAALVLEAHREWTPERVKSAIVSTASAFPNEETIVQGAGGVRMTAVASDLEITPAVINLGIAVPSSAPFSFERTLTVRNEAAGTRQFSIAPSEPVSGVTIAIEPPQFELAGGASRQVTVRFSGSGPLPDPGLSFTFASTLRISSNESQWTVPWGFVYAARTTVKTDLYVPLVLVNGPGSLALRLAGASVVESLMTPGVYDIAVLGLVHDAMILLVSEKFAVTGDQVLERSFAEATNTLTLSSTEIDGQPLGASEGSVYEINCRLVLNEERRSFEVGRTQARTIRTSPFSDRFTLLVAEQSIDPKKQRVYVAQHAPVNGVSGDRELRISSTDYASRDLRMPLRAGAQSGITVVTRWVTRRAEEAGTLPLILNFPVSGESWTATVYMTPESHSDFAGAVQVGTWKWEGAGRGGPVVASTPVRRDASGFFASMMADRPRLPVGLAEGEAVTFGDGIAHPFITTGGAGTHFFLNTDLHGRLRESLLEARDAMVMTLRDASGTPIPVQLSYGHVSLQMPAGAYTATLTAPHFTVSGLDARGVAELQFDTAREDWSVPSLTSLAVVNEWGRNVPEVRALSAPKLIFSAGDFVFPQRYPELRDLDFSKTRVFWRRSGTTEWTPAASRIIAEERGDAELLGSVPAPGWVYEADLREAVAVASPVDLRIEIADPAGNSTQWTVERAISVSPAASRRRAVGAF